VDAHWQVGREIAELLREQVVGKAGGKCVCGGGGQDGTSTVQKKKKLIGQGFGWRIMEIFCKLLLRFIALLTEKRPRLLPLSLPPSSRFSSFPYSKSLFPSLLSSSLPSLLFSSLPSSLPPSLCSTRKQCRGEKSRVQGSNISVRVQVCKRAHQ
jgi:hypothetical protein